MDLANKGGKSATNTMGVSCSKARMSCDESDCRGALLMPDSPRRHSSRRLSVDVNDITLLRLCTRALAHDIDNVSAHDIARLPGDLAQQLLSELVTQRTLDYDTLTKFCGQVLYDVQFSYMDDVDDEWLALLHAAPLIRVALRRCYQVRHRWVGEQTQRSQCIYQVCSTWCCIHAQSHTQITDRGLCKLQHKFSLQSLVLDHCIHLTDLGLINARGMGDW